MHQFLSPCKHKKSQLLFSPSLKIMQRQHNNGVLQAAPACAACKHQRKKCHEACPLAPYFPADRNREFQAVHKVFGVSNVTKMVKSVREEERRKLVVESLIWEAVCRQNDPVLGGYGEYKRVLEELKMCKLSLNQMGLGYKPIMPTYLGGGGGGIINNNGSNLFNYFNDNLSVIIDSTHYSNYSSSYHNLRSPEKLMRLQQQHQQQQQQDKDQISSSVVLPIQHQNQNQHTNFHHCF